MKTLSTLRFQALLAALALTFAGCASAPAQTQAPALDGDPRVLAFQQSLDRALSQEPAAIRRRYAARVLGVKERGSDLLFEVEVARAASFGHEAERFDLIAACGASALDDCVRKAMAAIRGASALD